MYGGRGASLKPRAVRRGSGIASNAISAVGNTLKHIPVGAVVNSVIDALPLELHLPGGYQYCGPGTKLAERLAKGDPGINKLDQACKQHDIAYSKYSDTENRSAADNILATKAWDRVKSSDASFGERAAALAVTAAMKAKSAVGGGHRRRRGRRKRRVTKTGRGRKTNRTQSTLKKTQLGGRWKVTKRGKGLYLRPYRSV